MRFMGRLRLVWTLTALPLVVHCKPVERDFEPVVGTGGGNDGGAGSSAAGSAGSGGESSNTLCSPGERRCDATSRIPQLCSASAEWENEPVCQFVCADGFCTGECSPGSRRCEENTGVPQVCNDRGSWQNESACGADQACSAGECLCTTLTQCGSACVDLDADPDHCGACDHSCLGGLCIGGECQPVEVVGGLAGSAPSQLALDDTHLYWAGPRQVKRVLKTGGTIEVVATDPFNSESRTAFGLGGGSVYWHNRDAAQIVRQSPDGSDSTEFAAVSQAVSRIIISDDVVYWNEEAIGAGTTFFARPMDAGTPPVNLWSSDARIGGFTVAAGCLYFSWDSALWQKCGAGNPIERFGATASTSAAHASDGTFLYLGLSDGGGLMRIALTGLANPTQIAPGAVVKFPAVDDEFVYYIEGDPGSAPACTENWSIFRVAKQPGSTPKLLVSGPLPCPEWLTFDDEALYWIYRGTGTLMKLAK